MWGFLNRGVAATRSNMFEPSAATAAGHGPSLLLYGGGRRAVRPPRVGPLHQSLSSLLLAVGPLSKRGRGHVDKCDQNHQDNINYTSQDSVVRTINDDFSARSLSRKDTVHPPPPTACLLLAAATNASPNNSVARAIDDDFPVTALSCEDTDGPTPPIEDDDGGNSTRSRCGGVDMILGGGI
jgi:hypothetical protein